jgi:hypothetical protein
MDVNTGRIEYFQEGETIPKAFTPLSDAELQDLINKRVETRPKALRDMRMMPPKYNQRKRRKQQRKTRHGKKR